MEYYSPKRYNGKLVLRCFEHESGGISSAPMLDTGHSLLRLCMPAVRDLSLFEKCTVKGTTLMWLLFWILVRGVPAAGQGGAGGAAQNVAARALNTDRMLVHSLKTVRAPIPKPCTSHSCCFWSCFIVCLLQVKRRSRRCRPLSPSPSRPLLIQVTFLRSLRWKLQQ